MTLENLTKKVTLEDLDSNNVEDDKSGFLEYTGKKIIMLDLNGATPENTKPRVEKTTTAIFASPHGSVLLFSDFRNLRFNKETSELAKQSSKSYKPFVKKSALVGIDGIKKIIFQAMITFSGRKNMKPFSSVDEAMKWLIED